MYLDMYVVKVMLLEMSHDKHSFVWVDTVCFTTCKFVVRRLVSFHT